MGGDSCARSVLFGKLPWAADYVRMHHVHPAALALDAWLQASQQQLAQAGVGWPGETLRFSFSACGAVATGVLAPSRDRAGREFPVALFAVLPAAALAGRMAQAHARFGGFYDEAEHVLARAPVVGREATAAAVAQLRTPSLDARDALDAGCPDGAPAITAAALAAQLFHDAPERRLLRAAAVLARATRDAQWSGTTLFELPCAAPGQLAPWLTLLDAQRAVPSLFWCERAHAPRALLARAAPPPSLLLLLAAPTRRSARLCVLRDAPDDPDEAKLTERLGAASYQQSADRFFRQLATTLARARPTPRG